MEIQWHYWVFEIENLKFHGFVMYFLICFAKLWTQEKMFWERKLFIIFNEYQMWKYSCKVEKVLSLHEITG